MSDVTFMCSSGERPRPVLCALSLSRASVYCSCPSRSAHGRIVPCPHPRWLSIWPRSRRLAKRGGTKFVGNRPGSATGIRERHPVRHDQLVRSALHLARGSTVPIVSSERYRELDRHDMVARAKLRSRKQEAQRSRGSVETHKQASWVANALPVMRSTWAKR